MSPPALGSSTFGDTSLNIAAGTRSLNIAAETSATSLRELAGDPLLLPWADGCILQAESSALTGLKSTRAPCGGQQAGGGGQDMRTGRGTFSPTATDQSTQAGTRWRAALAFRNQVFDAASKVQCCSPPVVQSQGGRY
eukprot:3509294-Pyramimonas_sp.AAC.1